MKKIIKIAIAFFVVYIFLNFLLFRYDDWKNGCHIKLKPSLLELSNLKIKEALTVLRVGMPEEYRRVCNNIDLVEPDLPCGGAGGGCFHPNQGSKIVISIEHGGTVAHTASIIAHETCHYLQQEQKRPFDENECYAKGDEVTNALIQY